MKTHLFISLLLTVFWFNSVPIMAFGMVAYLSQSQNLNEDIFPLFNNTLPSEYYYDNQVRGWGTGDETPLPGDGGSENPGLWVDSVIPDFSYQILFLFMLLYVYRLFRRIYIIHYKKK